MVVVPAVGVAAAAPIARAAGALGSFSTMAVVMLIILWHFT